MDYVVVLKSRAVKDLRNVDRLQATRIADALERLQTDLYGDVKKLTNFNPEYRLRVGSYRVLFEIEGTDRIVVDRKVHRREV